MLLTVRLFPTALAVVIPLLAAEGGAQASYAIEARPVFVLEDYDRSRPLGRVVGAATLSDGSIAVADASSMALFIFTKDGKPKAAFGREGGGPGEFRSMVWMGSCDGKTVSLFDPVQNRVTTVDASGKLSDVSLARPLGPAGYFPDQRPSPAALVCGPTGARVMVGWLTGPPPTKPGPYRANVNVAYSVAGGLYKRLGTFAGPERVRYPKADGPRQFGKTLLAAASSNRLFVGTADSFHVSIYDLDGRKAGDIRFQRPAKRFNPEDRERFKTSASLRLPGAFPREQLDRAIDAEEFPEFIPAYSRFLVDASNRLWIEEGHAPSEPTRQWRGFSEAGELVGSLSVPAALELFEIGASSALGRWTDEDGAESVRRFRVLTAR